VRVRDYKFGDLAILREIYDHAGYDFKFPENLADFLVVVDDDDVPMMAAGHRLVPEITLLCAPGGATHPLVKLKGIALLHESLRDKLVRKGYSEAIASVPPELERSYGRHLQRHFQWQESWKTYRIRDWKEGA
jgi:hypothetical protein